MCFERRVPVAAKCSACMPALTLRVHAVLSCRPGRRRCHSITRTGGSSTPTTSAWSSAFRPSRRHTKRKWAMAAVIEL